MSSPANARDLTDALRPFGPIVRGDRLGFTTAPPADLLPVLRVLKTGVLAVLAGRAWRGRGPVDDSSVIVLNPAETIPAEVTNLTVESDSVGAEPSTDRWDAIAPAARTELPHLFSASMHVESSSFGPDILPIRLRSTSPVTGVEPFDEDCRLCSKRLFVGPYTLAQIAEGCLSFRCPYRSQPAKAKAA